MKTAKSLLLLACLAFAACNSLELEQSVPAEVQTSEPEGTITSKVTGQRYNASIVEAGKMIVKFNSDFTAEIEAYDGNVQALGASTKASSSSLALIRPVSLTRLFPDAGEYEERTRRAGLHKWYIVELPEAVSVEEAELIFASASEVEAAEFSLKATLVDDGPSLEYPVPFAAPSPVATLPFDDPQLGQQWHYINDGSKAGMVAGCDVDVLSVWENYTPGASDVIVSVVDGGIDYNHPDLAANMWTDPSSGMHGRDFISGTTIDPHNHGTHVAGTIGAVNNNGIGVCGLAGGDYRRGVPGVSLMSCQIFSTNPAKKGLGANTPYAIKWSADNGAVISQNSWGYDYDYNDDGEITGNELEDLKNSTIPDSLKEAIDYFIKYAGCDNQGNQKPDSPMKGGVVIFAAGNDHVPYTNPADYEPIIAVTSVGADYARAYYSCYGDWADIIAPGGDYTKGFQVMSTLPEGKYGLMQGTSMACPHVSGVAALIISNLGGQGFTNDRLKELLLTTTNDEVLAYNTYPMGAGMVSATNAIDGSRDVVHELEPEAGNSLTLKVSQVRDLAFTVKNPTGHALNLSLSPEIPGFSVAQESSRRIVVTVDGKAAAQNQYETSREFKCTLTVTCNQESDQVHSVDFSVSLQGNNAPVLLRPLNGIVVDELGVSTKVKLSSYFFDADGETLVYTIGKCSLGDFEVNGDQVRFKAESYGVDNVEITATDSFGARISGTMPVLVRDGSRTFDIYPNPVSETLYVRASGAFDGKVRLYSESGALCVDQAITSDPFSPAGIDVRALSAGVYTVNVTDGKNDFSTRIVKY